MDDKIEMKPLQSTNGQQPTNGQPFVASSKGAMFGRFGYAKSRFGASYQMTSADKWKMIIFLILNTLLLVLSLGLLFAGFFCITYRGRYADLCEDSEWYSAAICLLVVGFFVLGLTIFSYIAIAKRSSFYLKIFLVLLCVFLAGEITAGIYTFARREYIEHRFQVCMKKAYQQEYMDPAKPRVTEAWDLFQDRFDCCGVDDPYDYRFNNKIPANGPKSCGGSEADARARQPCFPVIKRRVLDNFHIIGGSAIGIAGIQIATIIFGVMLVRIFYKVEENE